MPVKPGNPLYVQWIQEWYDEASERGSKLAQTYKNALKSMKACPATFHHPSEAQALHGLGPKLCARLAEKLEVHCEQNGLMMPEPRHNGPQKRRIEDDSAGEEPSKKARKAPRQRGYVPKRRSGAYAIIMALSSITEESTAGMTKGEIISIAQEWSDHSFTAPSEPNTWYTAWGSVKTLEGKELVYTFGKPTKKYALTEEGWELAKRIRAVEVEANAGHPTEDRLRSPTPELPRLPSNAIPSVSARSLPRGQSLSSTARSLGNVGHIVDLLSDGDDEPPPASRKLPKSQVDSEFHEITSSPTTPRRFANRSTSERLSPISSNITRQQTCQASKSSVKVVGGADLQQTDRIHRQALLDSLTASTSTSKLVQGPGTKSARLDASPQKPAMASSGKGPRIDTMSHPPTASQKPIQPAPTGHNLASGATSTQWPEIQPVRIAPGAFTVELILDNREVRSVKDRDYIQENLHRQRIRPLSRPLALGDALWVARVHDASILARAGEQCTEVVLDHILERKRLDDLIGSIKDGRFHEQKFRLQRSGLRHVTYLVEQCRLDEHTASRWAAAVESAIAGTQVADGFFVKRTARLDESIRHLARTTRALKARYEREPLYLIPSRDLTPESYVPTRKRLAEAHPGRHHNITYAAFAALCSKSDLLTLRDVFLKMLMCTRGVSSRKALVVQRHWETPGALVRAFELAGRDAPSPAEARRRREELVFRVAGGLYGGKKVGRALSKKIADVWAPQTQT